MDHDHTARITGIHDVSTRQSAVARRLDDGYVRIDQAILAGEDVQAWEDFWISLLAEYEALSDQLSAAA